MGKIRVLPEQVANKIAAGEVVERPSAIVKELTENSLDAGASQIEICVRHGGKSFIRVTDNGAGMSAEDAQISVQRHATSKIEKAEDLDEITEFRVPGGGAFQYCRGFKVYASKSSRGSGHRDRACH